MARRGRALAGAALAQSSTWRQARQSLAHALRRSSGKTRARLPPRARVGMQRLPGLGLPARLHAIVADPIGLLRACQAKYGDVFTVVIPFNRFDITYLLGRSGFRFVMGLPPEVGRLGDLLANLPAMGFWLPKKSDDPAYVQALITAGRRFLAESVLSRPDHAMAAIARQTVQAHSLRFLASERLDLAGMLVPLIHDAACRAVVGDAVWDRIGARVLPALGRIADSVDVLRVTLARTPYRHFMPEREATETLYAALAELAAENRRGGGYPFLDAVAGVRVSGEPLPDSDIPWMVAYLLWEAVVYLGTYGVWALVDLVSHPALLAEVRALAGPARAELLWRAVLETLRRNPVATLSRYLAASVEYEHEGERYFIPAGTYVTAAPIELAHDPAVYAQPERYDPGRYGRGEPLPPVFGKGHFACVAQRFTRTLLVAVLDELTQHCEIELLAPPPERLMRLHLLYPSRSRWRRTEEALPARLSARTA